MTPCRTEKVDFSKKKQKKNRITKKNKSTGRITKKTKKSKKTTKKTKKNKKNKKKTKKSKLRKMQVLILFFVFFLFFSCFFLGFGFPVCFFCLLWFCFFFFFFIFFVKPYILCAVGLIIIRFHNLVEPRRCSFGFRTGSCSFWTAIAGQLGSVGSIVMGGYPSTWMCFFHGTSDQMDDFGVPMLGNLHRKEHLRTVVFVLHISGFVWVAIYIYMYSIYIYIVYIYMYSIYIYIVYIYI